MPTVKGKAHSQLGFEYEGVLTGSSPQAPTADGPPRAPRPGLARQAPPPPPPPQMLGGGEGPRETGARGGCYRCPGITRVLDWCASVGGRSVCCPTCILLFTVTAKTSPFSPSPHRCFAGKRPRSKTGAGESKRVLGNHPGPLWCASVGGTPACCCWWLCSAPPSAGWPCAVGGVRSRRAEGGRTSARSRLTDASRCWLCRSGNYASSLEEFTERLAPFSI